MNDDNQPLTSDDDEDITLQNYQDDIDTHGTDRVMDEFGDDPTKLLGVSPTEFKHELSRYDDENPSDDFEGEPDDMSNEIESIDEDPDRSDS
jgi:hypothetical protein